MNLGVPPSVHKHDPYGRDIGGGTGLERATSFIVVRTAGVRELVEELKRLASVAESDRILSNAVRAGSRIIADDYRTIAERHGATGNLGNSVTAKQKQPAYGLKGSRLFSRPIS